MHLPQLKSCTRLLNILYFLPLKWILCTTKHILCINPLAHLLQLHNSQIKSCTIFCKHFMHRFYSNHLYTFFIQTSYTPPCAIFCSTSCASHFSFKLFLYTRQQESYALFPLQFNLSHFFFMHPKLCLRFVIYLSTFEDLLKFFLKKLCYTNL